MLLLLLSAHLLSKNGSASPVLNPLEPRNSTDTCDDINNCRKLFDVVWGCLATIFACTWVSVHQNVPPPGRGRLALFWRRLKMMLAAVLAPELIVGFAARQFLISRRFSEEFGFSKTHAFFVSMGGFVSSNGYPVTTRKQLEDPKLGAQFLASIWEVDVEDITDKSKGDALSKGLALAQGLWFTVQCLARVHQHLAVTQLEVATLAFAVVNVFIWVLWWDKPLDVHRPIVVGPPKADGAEEVPHIDLNLWTRFASAITGTYNEYDPMKSSSVPSFWAGFSGQDEHEQRSSSRGVLFEQLVAIIFGAIHCTAWNSGFPTAEEAWIWRGSSLSVTAEPVIFFAVGAAIVLRKTKVIASFAPYMFIALILIYIIARIALIILALVALRELPPSAFVDVNWSLYIPHLY